MPWCAITKTVSGSTQQYDLVYTINMTFPATRNFEYYDGDTVEFVVYPKNADGSAFNLSSYTSITYTIADKLGNVVGRNTYAATATKFSLPDPPNGDVNDIWGITCTLFPSVGNSLVPGTPYYYDVEISKGSDPTKYTYTILKGQINVTAGVVPNV